VIKLRADASQVFYLPRARKKKRDRAARRIRREYDHVAREGRPVLVLTAAQYALI
jgi:hypothetical protein